MDKLKSFFSNKIVLAGIGGTAIALLLKKSQKNEEQPEKQEQKKQFGPLLSPFAQQCFFGFTSAVWFLQLNKTLFPQASTFIANELHSLYPLVSPILTKLNVLNKVTKNIFSTKKNGLIIAGGSMALLTAYRKSSACESIVNKILINRFTMRIYELIGYSMPWIVMIKSAESNTNSFNSLMKWFSMIFISNAFSAKIYKPIFSCLKIRHMQYFALLSYSLGMLSPNVNLSDKSYLVYSVLCGLVPICFVGYKLGFDNGNMRAYPFLAHLAIPLPYLYFKPEISLYMFVFYFIPNFYYLYYVMGIPEITEIVNGVYLANMPAINEEYINKYEIKNILEVHDKYKNPRRLENVNYLSMELDDRSFVQIKDKFGETNDFISQCVEKGESVVVHCSAGASRSASIVTAYLIYSGYSYQGAMKQMNALRESFDPNTGFRNQLKEFAEQQ